jgi:hypothetical protein
MKRLLILVLALNLSCSTAMWEKTLDTMGEGAVVASSAAVGGALGGPLGAGVGAVLGFFGLDLAELKIAFAQAQADAKANEEQHHKELADARKEGVQQGTDNANQTTALLMGDKEALEYIRTQAQKSIEGTLDPVKQEIKKYVWRGIITFIVTIAAYLAKQWWWDKRLSKKFVSTNGTGNGDPSKEPPKPTE